MSSRVVAPQYRAALAPEQQPLRTEAGVLLHVGPEFLDEEVRLGDVPDDGDPARADGQRCFARHSD
jgi:hypothetical protein